MRAVNEDIKLAAVRKEGAEVRVRWKQMLRPLKGTVERKRRKSLHNVVNTTGSTTIKGLTLRG